MNWLRHELPCGHELTLRVIVIWSKGQGLFGSRYTPFGSAIDTLRYAICCCTARYIRLWRMMKVAEEKHSRKVGGFGRERPGEIVIGDHVGDHGKPA